MRLFRRVLGYGVLTIGACSVSTYAAVSWSPQFNRKFSSNGAVRFGRAALVVAAVSFDYKTSLWGASIDDSSKEYELLKSQVHLRSALRLRDLCCVNGGTYIKVGQYIGTLDYLLPVEYVRTMRILHDDAPQSSLSDIHAVIEEELGSPVEKLFLDFEKKPLGAASLAQVHKATLMDGRTVAVKVQHRYVQKNAAVDMETLEFLARAVAWLFPEFGFLWLVDESKRNLPLELDFENEGKNAEKVAKIFKACTFLKVPQIYWDLSTKRVLTMEFCDGGKVDDLGFMKEHNISCDEVSRKLGWLYSQMIFTKGFVHCDPHPGNVLVRKNPVSRMNGVEIVLLDHGLYHTLTDDFRVSYCKLWQSLIAADVEGIKRHSDALGVGHMYGLLACMLTARSWKVVTAGINEGPVSKEEADEIRDGVTTYLGEISQLLNSVPRQLLLLFKTNDLLRSIDYRLQTTATARSFITMSRCCVRTITEENLRKSTSWYHWLKIHAASVVAHTRISLYQLYVSNLVTSVRQALCVITSHLTSWNRFAAVSAKRDL